MIANILKILAFLPTLFSGLTKAFNAIKDMITRIINKYKADKMKEGIEHATQTGDSSKIEDLLNPHGPKPPKL